MLPTLLLMLACSTSPPSFWDCGDAACRLQTLPAALDEDAERVVAVVAALPDEVERAALATAAAELDAGVGGRLCETLPAESPARFKCERTAERPHLRMVKRPDLGAPDQEDGDPVQDALDRPGGGAPEGHLPPPAPGKPPWDGQPAATEALRAECSQDPVPARCIETVAEAAAAAGDVARAGLACEAGASLAAADAEDPEAAGLRSRDECIFRAAEALAAPGTPERLAAGLQLCGLSRWYGRRCTSHVLTIHAQAGLGAPTGSDDPVSAELDEVLARAEALRAAAGDDSRGDLYVSLFLARYVGLLAEKRPRETPALLAALVARLPEAAPHARMGHAFLVATTRSDDALEDAGLDALAAMVRDGATDDDAGPRPRPGSRTGLLFSASTRRDAWSLELPGEDALPAVHALGLRRRTLADDPTVDARIALLEALSMRPSPPVALLASALTPDAPRQVRWTAARLVRQVAPDHPLPDDPDPLVQARVEWRPGQAPPRPQPDAGGPGTKPPLPGDRPPDGRPTE